MSGAVSIEAQLPIASKYLRLRYDGPCLRHGAALT